MAKMVRSDDRRGWDQKLNTMTLSQNTEKSMKIGVSVSNGAIVCLAVPACSVEQRTLPVSDEGWIYARDMAALSDLFNKSDKCST